MRFLGHVVTAAIALSSPVASSALAQGHPAVVTGPGEIRGRITDAAGHGIMGGSITVRRAVDTAFAGGGLPDAEGRFRVDGLPLGRYVLRVRALGYAPFAGNAIEIAAAAPMVDVGMLTLASKAAKLAGQMVTAERQDVVLAPDRNSYAVKNIPGVAGGSAVDVLRSTPSVEVDGSDNVSLRGSANVVIQINGRATPLKGDQLAQFLKQIPVAALDHVEVATNPNAKSDPEGTAGIINLVLKGDVEIGLSASMDANMGTTSVGTSGNIAQRRGPLTLFIGGGVNQYQNNFANSLDRVNLVALVPASLRARSTGHGHPRFYNFRLRGEYKIGERDVLSSEGSLFAGSFPREITGDVRDYDASGRQIGSFLQLSEVRASSHGADASVTYRHSPTPKLTSFTAEVNYSRNRNLSDNLLGNRLLQADASTANVATSDQRDLIGGLLPTTIAQADYTHPFGELLKLESGVKHTWRTNESDGTSSRLDPVIGSYVDMPERTAASNYQERIGAVYGVLSEKVGAVTLQQGLRLEETSTRFALPLTNGVKDFATRYGSAFPSAIATYAASLTRSARASYARRIARPYPGLLSPVPNRIDGRTVFQGNPALQPEYIDAYELNLQDAQGWGTIQINPYFRRSAHAFRFIRRVDSLGVSTQTFANVASTQSTGVDVSLTYRHGPLNLTTGGGSYRFVSDAGVLGPAYSVRTQVWNVRVNATATVRPTTTLQFLTNYRGAQRTEGGATLASVFMNGGIRQQLWNGKGSVNLGVQDPFGLLKFGGLLEDGRVFETTEGIFSSRQLTFSVSRTFGKNVQLKDRITQVEAAPPAATP